MRRLVAISGVLLIVAGCVQVPAPRPGTPAEPPAKIAVAKVPPQPAIDVDGEAARLRAALADEVPAVIVDTPAHGQTWIALSRTTVAVSNQSIDRAQILVVVDRNPDVQQLRLVLARSDAPWQNLGGGKVSTGESGRRSYYVTPTGVFPHTDLILDWLCCGDIQRPAYSRPGPQRNAGMGFWLAGRGKGLGDAGRGRDPASDARHRPGLSRAAARSPCLERVRAHPRCDEPVP